MTGDPRRKRPYSQDDVDDEQGRSSKRPGREPRLQTKITELIERHETQCQPAGRLSSESLMSDFIRHIWPEIRDDYRQMTRYLEEDLKKILKEGRIDAEVFSRVKEDASISKTLQRRQKGLLAHRGSGFNSYQDIFHEMHDLSGLRIVLMNPEDYNTAQNLIEYLFKEQKPPAHFHPKREVGQFWKRPWFGAYETRNHRVQLANNNRAALGASDQYSGVTFEIQLTTFSDNLYNKLAHDLLYKADPGLVTGQEEMVMDVSHGLARCFELCMRILQPKLHRDTDDRTPGTTEELRGHTEMEVRLAQSVVDRFEKDLHDQSKSDRTAQLLRKLLNKNEDAEDQACLRDLIVSDPRNDKLRIEETKGGLLPRSYNWILEDHDFQRWREHGQNQPFWITGAPGKGKTMLLCGIINELKAQEGTNVSYFFCQGTDKRLNTGTAVLRGLLFLLCNQQRSLVSYIRNKYDNAGGKLFEDANAWVALCGIFDNMLRDPGLRHTYLIVDALDECLPESQELLADLIVRVSNSFPTVKWIVSSRELEGFKPHLRKATQLSLESRGESVSEAVNAYIDSKMANLGDQDLSYRAVSRIADELKMKSGGTFLWVAIVYKELESAHEFEAMEILQEMPRGLNELYGKVVQDINCLKRKTPMYCRSVLRAVAVAFRPLTLKELQELADLPENIPADTIAKMCRSFLTLRDDTVYFVHQSAKDYLSNEWDTVFQSSIRKTHESMFSRSVHAMKRILHQDIYNLRHPGISIEDIQQPSPDPLVPIRYSCVYWITHFREAQASSAQDQVDGFLRSHFLYWFEALSLIRSTSTGVHALRDLVALSTQGTRLESLLHLASDMYRFVRSNRAIIAKAPLQAYSSALIFSPARSLTRLLFTSKEPDWIVRNPSVEQHWNSCLTTLTGHLSQVRSVAFSPDGHRIVSGSFDSTIKIWDAEIGVENVTLSGHTDRIWSVAFDGEGKVVKSKSHDTTAKTWDAETGDCVSTSDGSREPVDSLIFSPDRRRHATCLPTGGIRITGSVSTTEALTLRGHSERVRSVDFSRDGSLIASGSDDKTVKIWNAVTGDEILTLQGHNGAVLSVCFSPDAHRIASGSSDETIKIWDVDNRAETPTPRDQHGHRDQVNSVALAVDGRRIASGSRDGTVKIWDAETGDIIQTLDHGFEHGVWPVTFSPDGHRIAFAGYLETVVVISDVESGAPISTCSAHCVGPFALSLDGRYIANGWANNVVIRDVKDVNTVLTLEGHSGDVTSLAFSPKDRHIVVSASGDKTIKIWNVATGIEIAALQVDAEIRTLRFDSTSALLHADSLIQFRDCTWPSNSTTSQTGVVLPQLRQDGYGIGVDGSWITWHGRNILWLPPEFRKTDNFPLRVCDALPHMVSIGCPSGRVWWLSFSPQHQPFAL